MNSEYAEEVAGRIIEQLRQGTAPWQKPWQPGELRLPYNAATGKDYRGMNTIWLHMQGYADPRWMTYKQAEAEGAQVRKGSRGTRIIYWKFHDEQPMKDAQGRPVLDDEGKPRKIRVELDRPRVFTAVVFNAEQIDGMPPLQAKPLGPEPERHARAEAILSNSGAKIAHVAGDHAFYRPSTDSITLPTRQQFSSVDAFYATALHELGHWSGHDSRLARDLSHPFGSEGYAREELRAEISSLMLGERLEIGHDPGQHAAYVASWIKVLEDDPREIFRAAADAEKINSYVMAFELEQAQDVAAPSIDTAAQQQAAPSVDPQQLREEANRRELHAIQRADPDLTMQESDREIGETFARLLRELAEQGGEQGRSAGVALERFGDAYQNMGDAQHWQAIGYDLRTGTGTALPSKNLPPIVNAVALRALSGGARPELTGSPSFRITDRDDLQPFTNLPDAMAAFLADRNNITFGHSLVMFEGGREFGLIGHDWYNDGSFHRYTYQPPEIESYHVAMQRHDTTPEQRAEAERNAVAAVAEHPGKTRQREAEIRAEQDRRRDEAYAGIPRWQPTPQPVEIGSRVRFTPNEERAAMGGMTIEGVVIDIAPTTTGNQRYRIRTDEVAPQGGQPQEWLIYSNQGSIERLPARDVAAGPTPQAAAALDAAHRNAVPTYSPLETWQNLEATAQELGLVAAVRLIENDSPEQFRAPFQVSYTHIDGRPSGITTSIFRDGKALTGVNGARVSPFITEDHESQSSDLRTAHGREREQRPPVQQEPPEASSMTAQRTYLIVPYRQKDEAKKAAQQAGFRLQWDKEAKQWFAPEGIDVKQTPLARYLPENTKVVADRPPTPEQSFADAIRAAGLELDGLPEMDGKIYRLAVPGDKGAERSGAYAGHMEGRTPGGYIQNYKTGERINWKYEGKVDAISAEERERLNREAVERAQRRTVESAAKHDAMAKIAQAVWDEAPPATADHPYCIAKGITAPGENGLRMVPREVSDEAKAAGVRIAGSVRAAKTMREAEPNARVFMTGDLLVPARDGEGKLWSVQSVNPNFKGFMKDGRKTGNYTVAGVEPSAFAAMMDRDPSLPLVLAEGYATGDTVARLRGHPVVVGFDSGNLDAVARSLRERWPDRPLLIAADNDHTAEQKLQPNGKPGVNVGLKKAQEAAVNNKGAVLVPSFGPNDKGSDWNDYAQQHGDEATRRELDRKIAQAKTEAAMNAERMMTLAREREAEARDDPTTSADDAYVANERAAAHGLMARAVAGSAEIRAEASDALVANATGAGRPLAAVSATLDRTNVQQADEIKEQRQAVIDGHNNSSESERATARIVGGRADARVTERQTKTPEATKPIQRRAKGRGAEL